MINCLSCFSGQSITHCCCASKFWVCSYWQQNWRRKTYWNKARSFFVEFYFTWLSSIWWGGTCLFCLVWQSIPSSLNWHAAFSVNLKDSHRAKCACFRRHLGQSSVEDNCLEVLWTWCYRIYISSSSFVRAHMCIRYPPFILCYFIQFYHLLLVCLHLILCLKLHSYEICVLSSAAIPIEDRDVFY